MFKEISGDIFQSDGIVAIPVNVVGVMGKGLAKSFALRYPSFKSLYQTAIRDGLLDVHTPCVLTHKGKTFIMFPTKGDWRNKSNINDIEKALDNLRPVCEKMNITMVALPALGCGCGELNYAEVKALVQKKFENDPDFKVFLYKPQ